MSPEVLLTNRNTALDSQFGCCQWNPGGPDPRFVSLDLGVPIVVRAVLWANDGGTIDVGAVWDPTTLLVSYSHDAMTWTLAEQFDVVHLKGSSSETVLRFSEFLPAARFWKVTISGADAQPRPRVLGLCDTPDCAERVASTGPWAVEENCFCQSHSAAFKYLFTQRCESGPSWIWLNEYFDAAQDCMELVCVCMIRCGVRVCVRVMYTVHIVCNALSSIAIHKE